MCSHFMRHEYILDWFLFLFCFCFLKNRIRSTHREKLSISDWGCYTLFFYPGNPRIWLQVRFKSCFTPFGAFHTVNSENHSSLCITLKLPVFPEVLYRPPPNLRLHPSRCFSTCIRWMHISGQSFDYRRDNTSSHCADKDRLLKILRGFFFHLFPHL